MATLVQRMIGAAQLKVATYEEVEADTGATTQAMLVVVMSAAAAGIGGPGRAGTKGFFVGAAAALVGWFLWALLTWLIGTKLLPEAETHADVGQLLRTTGFSASPGILRVLGIVPLLGAVVLLVSSIWMLIAMIVAVRQALDYKSTGRALVVCLITSLIAVLLTVMVGAILFMFAEEVAA